MRESEKALGKLIAFVNQHARFNTIDDVASALTEVKRLVDRDTPKKVIEERGWHSCVSCGFELAVKNGYIENYCSYCGQALEDES